MSGTVLNDTATGQGTDEVEGQPLVPPPKLRRRPALVAGGVVAVCLGALLGGWAWTSTTSTQEVLAARQSIERGSIVDGDDLARVRISADPALSPVPATRFDQLVGQRAAVDIAAGGLVTNGATTSEAVPASGTTVVGLALSPAQAPGSPLHTGDRVRIVATPDQGEDVSGPPEFHEAEVVAVHQVAETGGTVVDLLVPHAEATVVAAQVATGNVALVLDSRER